MILGRDVTVNEYYIYFLGDRMMEDSTKDLIQNEDVVLHPGESQEEIPPEVEELEYKPSKRMKIKF